MEGGHHSNYPSFRPHDQQQKQWPYLQRERSETWSTRDHVEASMSSQSTHGTLFGGGHEPLAEPSAKLLAYESEQVEQIDAEETDAWEQRAQAGIVRKPSIQEAEITVEGDELQIDRCLSYYMKRRTGASDHDHPEALSNLPSPMPQEMDDPSTLVRTADKSGRRSLKFVKTANLLEKIRRSQIRLNEEALSKAKSEGYRLSVAPSRRSVREIEGAHFSSSPASTTGGTDATKYDVSSSFTPPRSRAEGPKIPAHWRDSSNIRLEHSRNLSLARTGEQDEFSSSPHSAFEYADYYEGYLPNARQTSIRLEPASEAEDGIALPWQDHSPCRSSALSPRGSTIASVRQRSGTSSQASPMAWSPGVDAEGHAHATEGGKPGAKEPACCYFKCQERVGVGR